VDPADFQCLACPAPYRAKNNSLSDSDVDLDRSFLACLIAAFRHRGLSKNGHLLRCQKGQPLAYIDYEDDAGSQSAGKVLTRDEARLIAADVARLPEILRHGSGRAAGSRLPSGSRSSTIRNPMHAVENAALLVLGMLGGAAITFIALFGC